ncbi:hypothetical protein EV356DRAFT_271908 [Viridothelium virens]|uniref:Uncharacterized protein n=1 Tax=Viridothelium virens TaxID=1048519 RepID=A0A6A6H1Z1_VIRVR|nr:hypothetical protein EV356DRAFT_271908 [Viridothelium virens]
MLLEHTAQNWISGRLKNGILPIALHQLDQVILNDFSLSLGLLRPLVHNVLLVPTLLKYRQARLHGPSTYMENFRSYQIFVTFLAAPLPRVIINGCLELGEEAQAEHSIPTGIHTPIHTRSKLPVLNKIIHRNRLTTVTICYSKAPSSPPRQ